MLAGDDPRVFRASALVVRHTPAGVPAGDDWPPPGRVLELHGGLDGAATSLAIAAVAAAQRRAGITAWLQRRDGLLFPPDCADAGVDLDALIVIRLPTVAASTKAKTNAHAHDVPKAAELLLRSGGFDLVVLDLRQAPPPRGAWPDRLSALARAHQSRVLLLTDASSPQPFASGVSQRLRARRRASGDGFVIEPELVHDKLHAPPPLPLPHRAPVGLS